MDQLAQLARLEGVASALAATRDGIDALLRDRGLRRTSAETTGEALLRGAAASAALEGSELSLEEIRSGGSDAASQAAVRVSTHLLGLLPTLTHSPQQVLARLHVVAAGGRSHLDAPAGQPVDAQAAKRLRDLGQLLTQPTTAPGLAVAAYAHAVLVTAAPFPSHNGLIARAVERLVLVSRGVDPASVTVPEAGHWILATQYESNLRGFATGTTSGMHSWMLYAAEAFAVGAAQSPLANPGV